MAERRRAEDSWHLDKKVSVSHIMTTLTMVAGLVAWGISVDSRVTRLEVKEGHMAEQLTSSVMRIEGQLGSLNSKFDKMLERELEAARDGK